MRLLGVFENILSLAFLMFPIRFAKGQDFSENPALRRHVGSVPGLESADNNGQLLFFLTFRDSKYLSSPLVFLPQHLIVSVSSPFPSCTPLPSSTLVCYSGAVRWWVVSVPCLSPVEGVVPLGTVLNKQVKLLKK